MPILFLKTVAGGCFSNPILFVFGLPHYIRVCAIHWLLHTIGSSPDSLHLPYNVDSLSSRWLPRMSSVCLAPVSISLPYDAHSLSTCVARVHSVLLERWFLWMFPETYSPLLPPRHTHVRRMDATCQRVPRFVPDSLSARQPACHHRRLPESRPSVYKVRLLTSMGICSSICHPGGVISKTGGQRAILFPKIFCGLLPDGCW